MKAVEEYIKGHIRNDSNTSRGWHNRGVSVPTTYTPWVVPNVAREAAQIAREETIKEVCEYIKSHRENVKTEDNGIIGWIGDDFIEDLKKYMED